MRFPFSEEYCLMPKHLGIFLDISFVINEYLIVLWSKKMLFRILFPWNLLKQTLWLSLWPILSNVSCALEKNEYPWIVGCRILYKSTWLGLFIILFKSARWFFSSVCSINNCNKCTKVSYCNCGLTYFFYFC